MQALGVATDTVGAKRSLDTAGGTNANERSAEQMLRFGRVVGALVARVRAREVLSLQLEPG